MKTTERTMRWLKRQGYTPGLVERRLPFAFTTADLFGVIDIVAMKAGEPLVGVQATSGSEHAAHLRKIVESEHAPTWLRAGGRLWLVSWAMRCKGGVRGARKVWTPRVQEITLADFPAEAA